MKNTTVAYCHAIYFFVTGIWPFIHSESFFFITGPKTDVWLVKMVGLLATATAISITYALVKTLFNKAVLFFVLSISLSFAVIDCFYAFRGDIRTVYLGDATIESVFILLYLVFIKIPFLNKDGYASM